MKTFLLILMTIIPSGAFFFVHQLYVQSNERRQTELIQHLNELSRNNEAFIERVLDANREFNKGSNQRTYP